MVEIYMEKIQDLLVEVSKRGAPLEIKQNAVSVYVQGARKEPVYSYDQINKFIQMGDKNRSIGSTAMNSTSSRAHTIVTIELTKITNFMGKKSSTNSIINIVDLAGSEK